MKVVRGLRHRESSTDLECIDGDDHRDVSRGGEGNVGKDSLEATGLLQDKRAIALRGHDHPTGYYRGEIHFCRSVRLSHQDQKRRHNSLRSILIPIKAGFNVTNSSGFCGG
jgi:hypothetical protein